MPEFNGITAAIGYRLQRTTRGIQQNRDAIAGPSAIAAGNMRPNAPACELESNAQKHQPDPFHHSAHCRTDQITKMALNAAIEAARAGEQVP
ncbi:hypothetical protein O9993_03915 [Vibrio lentus]|nr:hypothetical protein [Vibrio lentus]